jgi:hypothetical protein
MWEPCENCRAVCIHAKICKHSKSMILFEEERLLGQRFCRECTYCSLIQECTYLYADIFLPTKKRKHSRSRSDTVQKWETRKITKSEHHDQTTLQHTIKPPITPGNHAHVDRPTHHTGTKPCARSEYIGSANIIVSANRKLSSTVSRSAHNISCRVRYIGPPLL